MAHYSACDRCKRSTQDHPPRELGIKRLDIKWGYDFCKACAEELGVDEMVKFLETRVDLIESLREPVRDVMEENA